MSLTKKPSAKKVDGAPPPSLKKGESATYTEQEKATIHPGMYALKELRDLLDEQKAKDIDLFNNSWDLKYDAPHPGFAPLSPP